MRTLLFWAATASAFAASYSPSSTIKPPVIAREYRGTWLSTVANIDWPSKPGLPTDQQKAELLAWLDRASQLKLNVVIFQVRPACDAFYDSKLEPWSEYLTGEMGKAPAPFWDPLAFAVDEAHKRGIELHAWFNPYRARHNGAKSAISKNHISKTSPQLVRLYGKFLWLDPGHRAVQDYSTQVILDVLKRYDIDGVHLDDYFYPYPENGSDGKPMEFPDDSTWTAYRQAGGKLARDDWRRDNVNVFVERLKRSIHETKPWVKFGISPFGIWRPDHPAGIKGFDQYDQLYADARKWLMDGTVDYFVPQLYWGIQPKEQSYPALLRWWGQQNPNRRHVVAGNGTYKVGDKFTSAEIIKQIELTRKDPGASGNIHFSGKSVLKSPHSLTEQLKDGLYREPALVPAASWLDAAAPEKPFITAEPAATAGVLRLNWLPGGTRPPWLWVLQLREGERWTTHILPGDQKGDLLKANPDAISITAISRTGMPSIATVISVNKSK
ncbi:MAG TPA: family 10 glycosylhydrolase [Roseimicrobium sp.]|nr:family 10 glycosylhydrolase [Roseimicrobium sp.]